MPPIGTKNLGLIKAIHVGVNPPLNTKILWYNDATTPYTTGPAKVHYYYDVILADWYPLIGGGGAGTFTYIAFASNCDGDEDFSFTFNQGLHCYWAIISSVNEVLPPALLPGLFDGLWTQFCSCSMPGEPGEGGNYTYIAFADDCEGDNFGLDPMYEVECTDCVLADSYNIASGSGAFMITPTVEGVTVDITNAAAGSEVFIDLTLNSLPLTDLIDYCVDITAGLQFSGEVEIHLGDEPNKLVLNGPATDWKNLLQNNGSQLILKIPDSFVGLVTTQFEIKIGTEECCSILEDGKCYCCREFWAIITTSTMLAPEEVVPALFENRWIAIGSNCNNSCDCDGQFDVLSRQIEALNIQLQDYMQINDQRITDLEAVVAAQGQELIDCKADLQDQINVLTIALNDYINLNNIALAAVVSVTDDHEIRISANESLLTTPGLAPLITPTIDASILAFKNGTHEVDRLAGLAYTDAAEANANTYTDGFVSAQGTTISDHEGRIVTLEAFHP